MNRNCWPGKSKRHEMPWGYEVRWNGLFHGKEIHIKKNSRTSLKFNSRKDELLYVSVGKVYVEYAPEHHFSNPIEAPSGSCVLQPGDFINVQAGCPYRVTAMQDSVVFEISTGCRSERVVIEDDYGREEQLDGKWIFNPPNS